MKNNNRLQVCEKNWMRRIAGVKRVNREKMGDLRKGLSIHKCLMGRLIESQMTWAGHVERMNEYPYQ